MRIALRAFLATLGAALVTFGLVPAAQASTFVFSVSDTTAYEYYWSCASASPYTCTTTNFSVPVGVALNQPSSVPITVSYQIVNVTAAAGQDFTGATSGTVTIPAWKPAASFSVPLLNDGLLEPDETFQVRLTGSSIGGDITDVGLVTIRDGGQIPQDCALSRGSAYASFVSCNNRPVTQQWYQKIACFGFPPVTINGNVVTGSGTSAASCPTGYTWKGATFEKLG